MSQKLYIVAGNRRSSIALVLVAACLAIALGPSPVQAVQDWVVVDLPPVYSACQWSRDRGALGQSGAQPRLHCGARQLSAHHRGDLANVLPPKQLGIRPQIGVVCVAGVAYARPSLKAPPSCARAAPSLPAQT